jgi:hypothetical protein
MRHCRFFDKYRDKELNQAELRQFESHLGVCPDCRSKRSLINNIAFVLKQDKAVAPDLAGRIALRAFAQKRTWDSLVVSWLRPGPALATLTLAAVLFSFLWMFNRQTMLANYSEYEVLMSEADSLNSSVSASQVRADNDLIIWLEQEISLQ